MGSRGVFGAEPADVPLELDLRDTHEPGTMPIRITIKQNGPYRVEGDLAELQLFDHEGKPVPLPEGKPAVSLCRCGASTNKPFCDGTHSKIGFKGAEEARKEFDAAKP
jgi:CDGSH-type Zn-finger protein